MPPKKKRPINLPDGVVTLKQTNPDYLRFKVECGRCFGHGCPRCHHKGWRIVVLDAE